MPTSTQLSTYTWPPDSLLNELNHNPEAIERVRLAAIEELSQQLAWLQVVTALGYRLSFQEVRQRLHRMRSGLTYLAVPTQLAQLDTWLTHPTVRSHGLHPQELETFTRSMEVLLRALQQAA